MSVRPQRCGIVRPMIDDRRRRGIGKALGGRRVAVERIEADRHD